VQCNQPAVGNAVDAVA